MTYRSGWWSVVLPPGWLGYADAACSTFQAQPPVGALQISAARKESEGITDGDLREFAEGRVSTTTPLQYCAFGAFLGVTAQYRKDGLFWQEWWLRSGQLMVYVTYNVSQEHAAAEQGSISIILSSLVPLG
jgi:hypothetical protein